MADVALKEAEVGTPEKDQADLVKGVVAATQQSAAEANIPSFAVDQAQIPSAQPVPASPDLEKVGATIVGSEGSPINEADVKHVVNIVTSPVTGKSWWGRLGGRIGNRLAEFRKKQKATAGVQKDSNESGIE